MPTYQADDGAGLHYNVLGHTGVPPLIVLAGGAGAHPDYLEDLAGLSQQHPLAVPHLRGVGRSSAADLVQRGTCWRQADDVDRLRVHLGMERCVLVAHSAGTRLAIAYAAQHPDHLAALVFITPPTSYLVDTPTDAAALVAGRMAEPVFAAAASAFAAGPDTSNDETFNAWQQACAPRGYASWGTTEQRHARSMWYSMTAARAFLSGAAPADLVDRLRAVQAPTLVVAGAQDVTLGMAPVVAVAGLFPQGQAAVIEDCGHFPWVERPDKFRDAVDPFLAQPLG